MIRPLYTWLAFVVCLILVCGVMGWLTTTTLQLERTELQAAHQSESERLALWRMESALVPLVLQESARPHFAYTAFYDVEDAYSPLLTPIQKGEVNRPSELLTHESPYIRLHFQFSPDGKLTSPQVPTSNDLDLAESKYITPQLWANSSAQLDSMNRNVNFDLMCSSLAQQNGLIPETDASDAPPLPFNPAPPFDNTASKPVQQQAETDPIPAQQQGNYLQQQLGFNNRAQQIEQGVKEFQRRNTTANSANFAGNEQNQWRITATDEDVKYGPMKAVWSEQELFLVRQTRMEGQNYLQGCWLHWENLRAAMLEDIDDLLPAADLIPAAEPLPQEQRLMLASLPVRLEPGSTPPLALPALTPVRFSLIIAWIGLALAAAAVAALLLAAVQLSERRGMFVSAVTHELRTPLTTFRMYTEMLAEGMVPTEEKRRHYLQTLRLEAERLGHLVENVLSYSRLEGTSAAMNQEPVDLGELLDRLEGTFHELAGRAGMTVEIASACREAGCQIVKADRAAIERILFNLVDNACKYGSDKEPRRIEIACASTRDLIRLSVRDHGSGISRSDARKLFRPFSKSAEKAAHSAPGVGLGLALCQRLARNMGGDLRIDHSVTDGACLVLELPRMC